MGDRVLVQVVSGSDVADATIYGHWAGESAIETIRAAVPTMRLGDPRYSAARLCAAFCGRAPGNTGVGILRRLADAANPTENESHGDAGIIVYDCTTGDAKYFHGYLADADPPSPTNLGIPPK